MLDPQLRSFFGGPLQLSLFSTFVDGRGPDDSLFPGPLMSGIEGFVDSNIDHPLVEINPVIDSMFEALRFVFEIPDMVQQDGPSREQMQHFFSHR